MPNKMLIDATHPEETRVIVLRGNRVEEFDFEAADRKQLRGNIYLAKVTRVEPSLQAAFVEYGGNRHGFLAFSEIHPDYYQIPVADRQALLEEEARAERDAEDEEPRPGGGGRRRGRRRHGDAAKRRREETISEAAPAETDDAPEAQGTRGADEAHTEGTVPAQARGEPVTETNAPDAPSADAALAQPSEPAAPEVPVTEADRSVQAETAPAPEHAAEPIAASEKAAEPAAEPAQTEPVAVVETPTEPVADHSGLEAVAPPAAEAGATPAVGEPEAEAGDTAETEASPVALARTPPQESEDAEDDADEAHEHAEGSDDDDDDSDEDEESDDEEDGDEEDGDGETQHVEQIGGDAMEEVPYRPARPRRHYKIQEVIKRRQVLLVQVVKEERGTKGAALTTYLSLAGRYSVLMPNTARGGGISRKITDSADRKRLKSIAEELEVPEGMGIILRTAGATRTKAEVKRDFEYLLRMWETVREVTLQSSAPTLVYEEGSLIKRAIRDLYNKDVEEILVAGEDGYKEAKDFMRLLMPSHAKNVQFYREAQPIFAAAGAEQQLDGMYFNQVTLRSGGYIVINQTEALVAIDVNSGRSTREHNIEDTALRTNLEAADEVARQLRLRDLAGLIVVDFIDMEEGRNNRAVERRMKEALKNDRARIQIGRISHFGLLEMSRQRIRTGVLEGSTIACPHCMGTGMVRATASIALHVLRGLEEALIKNPNFDVTVRTRTEVALYILNQKREHLRELEERFGLAITLAADATLSGVTYFGIDRGEAAAKRAEPRPARDLVRVDSVRPIFDDADEDEAEDEPDAEGDGEESEEAGEAGERRGSSEGGRRRRRRRRSGRDRGGPAPEPGAPQPSDDGLAAMMEITGDRPSARREVSDDDGDQAEDDADTGDAEGDEQIQRGRSTTRRRRRSRRGGEQRRGIRRNEQDADGPHDQAGEPASHWRAAEDESDAHRLEADDAAAAPQPANDRGDAGSEAGREEVPVQAGDPLPPAAEAAPAQEPADPAVAADAPPPAHDGDGEPVAVPAAAAPEPDETASQEAEARPKIDVHASVTRDDEPPRPKRSGWWQRAKATFGG